MREAGIQSVELTDYHPGFAYDDIALFERMREALVDLGMHLNSFHVHLAQLKDEYRPGSPTRTSRPGLFGKYDPTCDLASTDEPTRRHTLAQYRQAVDVMEVLGGGILVTHDIFVPTPVGNRRDPEADREHSLRRTAFAASLRELARHAAPKGVSFALENTSDGISRDPAGLVALVREVGEPNVGIVIDTGHRNLIGDVAMALRMVGEYLITLHIHDNSGASDEHLLPGRGTVAWSDVIKALRDLNYGGVFMYELHRPEDLPSIRENYEWLMREA